MCLIMTIIAAIAFSLAYLKNKKEGKEVKSIFTTMLTFWSAALMWSMDGIASVLGGEEFFDLSLEDGILGLIIIASGLLLFAVLSLLQKRKIA